MKNKLIWLLIALFSVVYSTLSILRHFHLESLGFDLGIYDQIIWLASKGKPLVSTLIGSHFFGDHFTPSLLFLVPLYWIKADVVWLLIFQSLIACLGVLPIYLIAKEKLHNEVICLTLSLSYLLFFGVQNALFYDFHPIVITTTLLSWMFWLYQNQKRFYFWLLFIIFLGFQENMAIFALALGSYFIIKKNIKYGLIIIFSSSIWLLLTIYIIIPFFNHEKFTYLPIFLLNLNIWEIIKLSYIPLIKLKTIFYWLLAFAFLPLGSPWIWLFIIEEVIQRFVGSGISTRWGLDYQYNIILTPVLALATIELIQKTIKTPLGWLKSFLGSKWIKKTYLLFSLWLILALIFVQITIRPSLNNLAKSSYYNPTRINILNYLIAKIPSNASMATTNNLASHLTQRQNIYLLTNCLTDKTKWIHETRRCLGDYPEYIIADLDLNVNVSAYYPDYSREKIIDYLYYLKSNFIYHEILESEGIVLLQKVNQ